MFSMEKRWNPFTVDINQFARITCCLWQFTNDLDVPRSKVLQDLQKNLQMVNIGENQTYSWKYQLEHLMKYLVKNLFK